MKAKNAGSFNAHALLIGILVITLISGVSRWLLVSGSAVTGKTQIAFWNGFTGPDGIVMLEMIEDFNRENPDVQVVMQRIPWATYYNKLTVAGSDHRGPQIFIVHTDALPRIRRAGFISQVDEAYGPGLLSIDDFDKQVTDYLLFDGHPEGIPLDIHPQGLYCNAEMLRNAGYVDAEGNARPPQNKAEFLDLIGKTTVDAGPKMPDKQWGFAFTYWGANFRSLVPQFKGRYLDENGDPELNSPQNIEALKFLEMLAKDNFAPPPDNGLGWFGYRTKRVAMVWDGVFMLGDLLRLNDMEYIGAPVPQIGPEKGTLANSHVMCINKHNSPKEREAALRFAKYISDNSLRWATAGQVPARKSIRANPEFKKLQVQSAFAEQIPTMMYPPKTPTIFDFSLQMDLAVERVVRGQATPKESLDTAQKECKAIIERDRAEHPEDYKRDL